MKSGENVLKEKNWIEQEEERGRSRANNQTREREPTCDEV